MPPACAGSAAHRALTSAIYASTMIRIFFIACPSFPVCRRAPFRPATLSDITCQFLYSTIKNVTIV